MLPEFIRFRTPSGELIEAPGEWQTALMEISIDPIEWPTAILLRNGEPLKLFQQFLAGELRILASWPLSGTGNYQLELTTGSIQSSQVVTVRPQKISEADYLKLLTDLQFRLPNAVALGLQKCGGLGGVELLSPSESTYPEELARLRDAVSGCRDFPGLANLLPRVARDPHQILTTTSPWVPRERARRPHPARLAQALARGGNLTEDYLPDRVIDSRVERSLDTYENQLLRVYCQEVELRLRRLLGTRVRSLEADALALLQQFTRARRSASFLEEVSLPQHLATRPTMVLLKRPEYRAVLDGYSRLHRSMAIRLDNDLLDAPLENLPKLYQQWCTLELLSALLEVAHQRGFIVQDSSMIQRDSSGFFVRILPNGRAAVVLTHPEKQLTVYLTPEMRFTASGKLRSISFTQQPDVTLWLEDSQDRRQLYLFDPKYKLDSEIERLSSQPKKLDIDKMHTYRDAIRDSQGNLVVQFAAILYPGKTIAFSGINGPSHLEGAPLVAISALPTRAEALQDILHFILGQALAQFANE
ncbi:MAG: DUF2357 domain-containing protein [Armatimonas sp.]